MHEFTIRGEDWRIEYEKRPGLWGECDFESRRITIHTQLQLRKRLEILVHEITHAIFPDAPEETVTEGAKVIAGILLNDGWKRGRVKGKSRSRERRNRKQAIELPKGEEDERESG